MAASNNPGVNDEDSNHGDRCNYGNFNYCDKEPDKINDLSVHEEDEPVYTLDANCNNICKNSIHNGKATDHYNFVLTSNSSNDSTIYKNKFNDHNDHNDKERSKIFQTVPTIQTTTATGTKQVQTSPRSANRAQYQS
ncbi:hypothetical protein ACA910_009281 [Epithemia clementina (nom. ined.)]